MTTRFPKESVSRFTQEKDFDAWKDRFHVVGLDLRDSLAIEAFCRMVISRFQRVDILVNNACQVCPSPRCMTHCTVLLFAHRRRRQLCRGRISPALTVQVCVACVQPVQLPDCASTAVVLRAHDGRRANAHRAS